MSVSSVAGSFRRLSVSDQTTYTIADHGPVIGNSKPMPKHTIKKAENELNETEDRKRSEIAKLRTLFEERLNAATDDDRADVTSVHALFKDGSDDVLIRYLRARKYDSERAYDLMKGYAKYRLKYPELTKNVKENEVRKWVELGQPGVLPTRDAKGRVVMFFSFENWDPTALPFSKAMEAFVYVLEKLLESQETQVNGISIVEDFSGYTMGQVAAVSIAEYKLMIDMLQGSFPCRFKGIHCIRQPWYFAKAFNIIKPFLKAKIFERVHVHGEELSTFLNEFGSKFIPENLGGSGPRYDGKAAANMLFGPRENDADEETAL